MPKLVLGGNGRLHGLASIDFRRFKLWIYVVYENTMCVQLYFSSLGVLKLEVKTGLAHVCPRLKGRLPA